MWRRGEDAIEWLVVYREAFRDWSFPKGGVEVGESALETALREVAEETGLRCEVGEPLPTQEWIRADGSLRRCRWWLMRPHQVGEPRLHDTVTRSEWFDTERALAALTYERDQALLCAALDLVPASDLPA